MCKCPIDRFIEKYDICEKTGCWIWTGHNSGRGRGGGYGRFSFLGRTVAAHRWIYQTFYGRIEADMQIDHTCRNRACVNPHHLEQVTHLENQQRKIKKG